MSRLRFLVLLSVVQAVSLISLLLGRQDEEPASAIEPRLQEMITAALASCSNAAAERFASLPDESRLRGIMREELAWQPQARAGEHGAPTAAMAMKPRDNAEVERQQQLVAQQVEAYISTGSITDRQLQDLQMQMAQLDAASRRQMMGRLMKALNSGALKGQL